MGGICRGKLPKKVRGAWAVIRFKGGLGKKRGGVCFWGGIPQCTLCVVNAGVPQGSILGSTLFLLYINELSDDFICNIATYADDTTLYCVIRHLICGNK